MRSRPRTYLKPADELVQRAVRLVSGLLHGPEVGVIPLGDFHVILCIETTDPRTMSMHRIKTCFVTCPHPPSAPCLLARVLSAPAASLQAETGCSRDGGSTGVTSLPLKQHGRDLYFIDSITYCLLASFLFHSFIYLPFYLPFPPPFLSPSMHRQAILWSTPAIIGRPPAALFTLYKNL